jgi:hypothetical protein
MLMRRIGLMASAVVCDLPKGKFDVESTAKAAAA